MSLRFGPESRSDCSADGNLFATKREWCGGGQRAGGYDDLGAGRVKEGPSRRTDGPGVDGKVGLALENQVGTGVGRYVGPGVERGIPFGLDDGIDLAIPARQPTFAWLDGRVCLDLHWRVTRARDERRSEHCCHPAR